VGFGLPKKRGRKKGKHQDPLQVLDLEGVDKKEKDESDMERSIENEGVHNDLCNL
jgi:hypothetical protein